jgi:hypothetical protein
MVASDWARAQRARLLAQRGRRAVLVLGVALAGLLSAGRASADGPKSVAAARNQDGTIETFYVSGTGSGAALFRKRQHGANGSIQYDSPTQLGWTYVKSLEQWDSGVLLGGAPVSAVAVGTNRSGRIEVFWIGAGGQMYHAYQTSPSSGYTFPAPFFGTATNIVVGRNSDGRLEVFFSGTDSYIYHAWQNAADSSSWGVGAFTAAPNDPQIGASREMAIGYDQNGMMDVFFLGSDSRVYHNPEYQDSQQNVHWWGTSLFAPSGVAILADRIAAASNPQDEISLITAEGSTITSWTQTATNSASWAGSVLATAATSTLAATRNFDKRIELFFVDDTNTVDHLWQDNNGRWSSVQAFGLDAAPTTSVAAVLNGDGRLEVLYTGAPSSILYHQYQLNAGIYWSGEYPLYTTETTPFFTVGSYVQLLAPYSNPAWGTNAPNPDPSWAINDHSLVQTGSTWTLFGIVAPNDNANGPYFPPAAPPIDWMGRAAGSSLTSSAGWSYWASSLGNQVPAAFQEDTCGVLWAPHVIHAGAFYWMFYASGYSDPNDPTCAGRTDPTSYDWSISARVSRDLDTWTGTRQYGGTVLFTGGGYQIRDPMVMQLPDQTWIMYYTSTDNPSGPGHHVVGYRTSTDLVHWSAPGIAYTDYHVGTSFGPTESPFVVSHQGYYCLFIGPRGYDEPPANNKTPAGQTDPKPNYGHPGYRGTDVFCGRSYTRWANSDYVGHIYSHAAEVVTDARGITYVTSAGIDQGGLYAAPLSWSF